MVVRSGTSPDLRGVTGVTVVDYTTEIVSVGVPGIRRHLHWLAGAIGPQLLDAAVITTAPRTPTAVAVAECGVYSSYATYTALS